MVTMVTGGYHGDNGYWWLTWFGVVTLVTIERVITMVTRGYGWLPGLHVVTVITGGYHGNG